MFFIACRLRANNTQQAVDSRGHHTLFSDNLIALPFLPTSYGGEHYFRIIYLTESRPKKASNKEPFLNKFKYLDIRC